MMPRDSSPEPTAKARTGRVTVAPPPDLANKLRRLVWGAVEATLYRWSPRPLHGWRCWLLRAFGAKIGRGAAPYPGARIWAPWRLTMGARSCLSSGVTCYNVGGVAIGAGAIVSQGGHLCGASHDHRDPAFPLLVGLIDIGAGAWVAADAFIGPGVSIGENAVVGARAVVMKDVEAGQVVAGNPAHVVGSRAMGDRA